MYYFVNVRDALIPPPGLFARRGARAELPGTEPTMHGLWCTYCYGAAPGLATRWARVPPCPSDPLPPQPSREGCVRRSGWHRAPGRGERLVLRWGGRQPPRGSSLLFYKYLYFFVARYCYLTLVRGSRDVLAAPRGSAVSVCPSQSWGWGCRHRQRPSALQSSPRFPFFLM